MDFFWWLNKRGFDASSWWMAEDGKTVNVSEPRLIEKKRENRSNIFRAGPIYWEGLRRHPELPELRAAACGSDGLEYSPQDLIERLNLVDPRCRGIAFYLIHLFELPWIDLPGDVPNRFEHYLPGFVIATAGVEPAKIRFPKASIDLLNDSATELGVISSLGRFIKEVDAGVIDSLVHSGGVPVAPVEGVPGERVLLLDRLEAELNRFGLDLSILAIQSAAANGTISESFRRSLDHHRPQKVLKEKPYRLQADILKHFHRLALEGAINASAKRKLKDWFNQFSFRGMIEDLTKGNGG